MNEQSNHRHISKAEAQSLAFKIIKQLDGVPMGQALAIVEHDVPLMLKDGHLVDPNNDRFRTLTEAFESTLAATV